MTATNTEQADVSMSQGADAPGQVINTEAGEKLKDKCCGCRLAFSWLPTSRSFDSDTKQQVANTLDVDPRSVSGSTKLYDSRHPDIKAANDIHNRIMAYWQSVTLPLAMANMSGVHKEGGVRLIRREDIVEFDSRMNAFASEARTIEQQMDVNRDDILDAVRKMLKSRFNPSAYPEHFKLEFRWGFPNVDVPSYLEQIAPEIYEKEVRAVQERFEHTYQLANDTILSEFRDVVKSWVDRLGPVRRLYPGKTGKNKKFHEAELIVVFRHANYPADIPEGHVRASVKTRGDDELKPKELTIGPMPEDEFFSTFKPSDVRDEKKTFKNSTITNLRQLVTKFRLLGEVASASDELTKVVDDIGQLVDGFADGETMAKELRNSSMFRSDVHNTMEKLNEQLTEQVTQTRRARRHVITD